MQPKRTSLDLHREVFGGQGSPQASSVRDRLLDTAADLFYREGVRAVGVDLVVNDPDELADQLVLLIDGAYVNGQLRGKRGPVHALPTAAAALIEAASA